MNFTRKIAPGLHQMSDGSVYNAETKKLTDPSPVLDGPVIEFNGKVFRKFNYIHDCVDSKQGTKGIAMVYCAKTFKKKKTTYAALDDGTEYTYPMKGNRLIKNNWVKFDFDFIPGNCYFLCIECNLHYPCFFKVHGILKMVIVGNQIIQVPPNQEERQTKPEK